MGKGKKSQSLQFKQVPSSRKPAKSLSFPSFLSRHLNLWAITIMTGILVTAAILFNLFLSPQSLALAQDSNAIDFTTEIHHLVSAPARSLLAVWPQPLSVTNGSATLTIDPKSFRIHLDPEASKSKLLQKVVGRFSKQIFATGCPGNEGPGAVSSLTIRVSNPATADDPRNLKDMDESYELKIPSNGSSISLNAVTTIGAIRGLTTFAQLVRPNTVIPQHIIRDNGCDVITKMASFDGRFHIPFTPIQIKDAPRFKHRGILIDTARHFLPVKSLQTILEGMAASKLNVFHWHIIDSQSFPLKSQVLPKLAESGAYSHFETYSKSDIDTIVAFAHERGIRVIPEFDMPGHAYSWSLAYPDAVVCANKQPWTQFCAGPPCGQLDFSKNATWDLVSSLLVEQMSWFPDPQFHLGNDEVNMECYQSDKELQERLARQSKSTRQMVQDLHVNLLALLGQHNKSALFWEEMATEFHEQDAAKWKDKVVIQAWKGSDVIGHLTAQGYEVIASPASAWYLDCGRGSYVSGGKSWCDPYKTWVQMYTYDPTQGINDDAQAKRVIGGEVAMWSEIVDESNLASLVFPRAAAAAESMWSTFSSDSRTAARANTVPSRDWNEAIYRLDKFILYLKTLNVSSSPLWPASCANGSCALPLQ